MGAALKKEAAEVTEWPGRDPLLIKVPATVVLREPTGGAWVGMFG